MKFIFARLVSGLALVLGLGTVGCAGGDRTGREGIDPRPEVRADSNPSVSFAEVVGGLSSEDHYLRIEKSALEKEFLFHANLTPQVEAATSSGLKARVVAFRLREGSVFLMQATQGHVLTDDLPSELLLTRFPVIRETDTSVTIDFGQGMNRVFREGNWYASDAQGSRYDGNAGFRAVEIGHSYVHSIDVDEKRVVIQQIAQVQTRNTRGVGIYPSYRLTYYLQPYQPDPTFRPLVTNDRTRVRFFEVSPVLEPSTGRSIVRTTRWHQDQSIVFHVSANTPVKYREAVREGILYWNKAFGHEVVRAEIGPVGVTAPHPDYNVVQWVPWDSAGFAYADALMDPRSGQILHAQAYLTSVFAFSGKARARRLLRQLKETRAVLALEAEAQEGQTQAYGLGHPHQQFRHASGRNSLGAFDGLRGLCDLDMTKSMISGLESALAADVSDEVIERLSRDYVRWVTAHEVGHDLGLRHNFAASLAANVSQMQRDGLYREYLHEGTVPDPRGSKFASSVMDYLVFEDGTMSSAQMASMDHAGDYDLQVIKLGYEGREMPRGPSARFCSDQGVGVYGDCQRFDSGANPVDALVFEMNRVMERLPKQIVEDFIVAKAPVYEQDRQPLEAVDLNYRVALKQMSDAYAALLRWYKKGMRSVQVEQRYPAVGEFLRERVQGEVWDWLTAEAINYGGVAAVLTQHLFKKADGHTNPDRVTDWKTSLEAYLARPDVVRGQGPGGRLYELTDRDIRLIKERAEVFFKKVDKELHISLLKFLSEAKFEAPQAVGVMEDELEKVARHYLTALRADGDSGRLPAVEEVCAQSMGPASRENAAAETPCPTGRGRLLTPALNASDAEVHPFVYKKTTRETVITALAQARGIHADWSLVNRHRLQRELKALVNQELGRSIDRAGAIHEIEGRELRRWVIEQLAVLKKLKP